MYDLSGRRDLSGSCERRRRRRRLWNRGRGTSGRGRRVGLGIGDHRRHGGCWREWTIGGDGRGRGRSRGMWRSRSGPARRATIRMHIVEHLGGLARGTVSLRCSRCCRKGSYSGLSRGSHRSRSGRDSRNDSAGRSRGPRRADNHWSGRGSGTRHRQRCHLRGFVVVGTIAVHHCQGECILRPPRLQRSGVAPRRDCRQRSSPPRILLHLRKSVKSCRDLRPTKGGGAAFARGAGVGEGPDAFSKKLIRPVLVQAV